MILHYLEGRTCEEIGAKLGSPAGSIRRILHYSRRKARKEYEAMTEASAVQRGPRRVTVWIDGSPGDTRPSVFDCLRSVLAQTVCLSINKSGKTVKEIAEHVGAHEEYVEQVVTQLQELEVVVPLSKGRHLANFICFDNEDWRRLMRMVPQPSGEVAKRLAAAEARLRTAFGKTPLAGSGWAWQDVIWPVYAVLVANTGASRNEPESYRLPSPGRPGGGRYWLGGHEEAPGSVQLWTTGFNSYHPHPTLNHGYFWTWGMERQHTSIFGPGADAVAVEAEALAELGDDGERWRAALAGLIQEGFLERTNGELRLTVPVLTRDDSDLLTPEVDAVIGPIVNEVVVPALTDLATTLDKMGYDHRREQYPQWQRWVAGNMMGEALRFLMEQGVLPRPEEPTAATFAFIAWERDLPVMSWGADY
jgi:hypothetical protein